MWVSPTKIREFIKETQCQLTKNKYGGLTNTNDVENHLKKKGKWPEIGRQL